MPQPFRVRIAPAVLEDLRQRLAVTRWPDEIENEGWEWGTNRTYLRDLCAYWQSGFDWTAPEARIDAFPHFKAEVDGMEIHFLHQKGNGRVNTLYWATETATSAARIYYEANRAMQQAKGLLANLNPFNKEGSKSKPPAAFALFPKDISHPPRELAERFFNVQRWTKMKAGGHFAALEQPELLADDLRAFAGSLSGR